MYNKTNNPNADKLEDCRQFQPASPGKVCDVKVDQMWHPCLKEVGYNFESPEGGPCIFLKLNRVTTSIPFRSKIYQIKLNQKNNYVFFSNY